MNYYFKEAKGGWELGEDCVFNLLVCAEGSKEREKGGGGRGGGGESLER